MNLAQQQVEGFQLKIEIGKMYHKSRLLDKLGGIPPEMVEVTPGWWKIEKQYIYKGKTPEFNPVGFVGISGKYYARNEFGNNYAVYESKEDYLSFKCPTLGHISNEEAHQDKPREIYKLKVKFKGGFQIIETDLEGNLLEPIEDFKTFKEYGRNLESRVGALKIEYEKLIA